MIVLDASSTLEWLLQTPAGLRLERRLLLGLDLHAPHLLDLEVANVLRRFVRERLISQERALAVLLDLQQLRVTRYPHDPLLPRIWELRDRLTAYDAAYIALAEELGATMITRDRRLAAAGGHHAKIEVI